MVEDDSCYRSIECEEYNSNWFLFLDFRKEYFSLSFNVFEIVGSRNWDVRLNFNQNLVSRS